MQYSFPKQMTAEFPSDGDVRSNTRAMYDLRAIMLLLTYTIDADMGSIS